MILERIYSIINSVGILKEVSFEFQNAKFYYITVETEKIGSYLFDCIGLVSPIMEGKFIIDDIDISSLSYKEKAAIRRKNIGFIFNNILLDPDFNVFDNIMLPLVNDKSLNKQEKKAKVTKLLVEYNMSELENKYPQDLSLYDKQRVSLLRAIVANPKFVIAYEPTELFRKEEEKKFYDLLKNLNNKGIGVIIITRKIKFPKYADEIYFYENKFM